MFIFTSKVFLGAPKALLVQIQPFSFPRADPGPELVRELHLKCK